MRYSKNGTRRIPTGTTYDTARALNYALIKYSRKRGHPPMSADKLLTLGFVTLRKYVISGVGAP